jgi:hypothetical protein
MILLGHYRGSSAVSISGSRDQGEPDQHLLRLGQVSNDGSERRREPPDEVYAVGLSGTFAAMGDTERIEACRECRRHVNR